MFAGIICFIYLTAASLCDIRYGRIPNYLTISAFVIIITYDLIFSLSAIPLHLVCSLFFLIVFLTARFITKGIGYGDIKLAAVTGYCMGFIKTSSIFIISALLGITIFCLLRVKGKRIMTLPFAPLAAAGFVISQISFRGFK